MKKINFKKYICLVFFIPSLIALLCVSYYIDEQEVTLETIANVYAVTAQSSTSTKQSSTSKETKQEGSEEISDEMVDLLAKVINAEARGEPYLRSSSSRCSNNE